MTGRADALERRARRFRRLKLAAALATDFPLLVGGLAFDFPHLFVFPPTAVVLIPLLVALLWLRRYPKYKKNIAVVLLCVPFLVLTFDAVVLMQVGIYGWKPALLAAVPLSYVVALRFRRHPFLEWDAVQAFFAPLLVTFVISSAGDFTPSREACARVSETPGARLVYSFPTRVKARFVLRPKGREGLLVSFRKGLTFPVPGYEPKTLEYVDPATGAVKEWLTEGEVIGLYQAPDGGEILAVVISPVPDRKHGASYMDLVVFDDSGRVVRRLPMPEARSDYYSAVFFPRGDALLIIVEWNLFSYRPGGDKVKLEGIRKDYSPYNVVQYGDSLYGVSCKSPLIMLTAPTAVMRYDLKTLELTAKLKGGAIGYYDIRRLGNSPRFVASYAWGGGGILFDGNLKVLSNLNVPRGVRNIAMDGSGRYMIAPNFFSGVTKILDVVENRLLPGEYYIGKGTRSMNEMGDGKVLVANSCGLVEVDPDKMVKRSLALRGGGWK